MLDDRKIIKIVDIDERQFEIKKLPAYESMELLFVVIEKMAPAIPSLMEAPDNKELMVMASSTLLGDANLFKRILDSCLKNVKQIKPEGTKWPVINAGGQVIPEFEYDSAVLFALALESAVFNIEDFFTESGFQRLSGILSRIKLPNLSM